MKKFGFIIIFLLVVFGFFYQVFLQGKLPIPADTIVGLYHPYRDFYTKKYPRGIPFKNFLITDPVRQQFPWRSLSIDIEKKLQLPLWNPYTFAGTPLLGNMQSAPFYPFNLLFFILPFPQAWTILIVIEPLLAGVFLYWYLQNLHLHKYACFLGAITFSFCGFFTAWLEWNTILHVALWLPLLLLAKDHLIKKLSFLWIVIFLIAECFAIFAGHAQTYLYFFLISNLYLFVRLWKKNSRHKTFSHALKLIGKQYIPFLILGIGVFAITFVQWFPAIRFIIESAREVDQIIWGQPGWFIPWQHLIQFIAPDIFGNPTTLNYWGVWNYGEFIGYVGIVSLLMAFFALFFRHDKKTLFFGTLFFLSLLFSLPTPFAEAPYILKIPLISTSQPTRLLFVTDFSLAILAALGFDLYMKNKKGILYPAIFLGLIFVGLWIIILFGNNLKIITTENLLIAKRNLIFPFILFIGVCVLIISSLFLKRKPVQIICILLLLGISIFDLLRFSWKFTSFSDKNYLFPQTKIILYLQQHIGAQRFMTTDSRILPPNFSTVYKLQSVDGYDPLYLRRYGELIAASERNKPNISPPFGFNRIVTPHNYNSKIINLLGVKYVLSLSDVRASHLTKVFQEGETRLYENKNALPKAFFVDAVVTSYEKGDVIKRMFDDTFDPRKIAIIEVPPNSGEMDNAQINRGTVKILKYSENEIIIQTENSHDGFLVLTDSYYPIWKAYTAREGSSDMIQLKIYRTDFHFRGVYIPAGLRRVVFYNEFDQLLK